MYGSSSSPTGTLRCRRLIRTSSWSVRAGVGRSAFVQERHATKSSGRSWLFFGDRTFTHDFLYQLDWQDARKTAR